MKALHNDFIHGSVVLAGKAVKLLYNIYRNTKCFIDGFKTLFKFKHDKSHLSAYYYALYLEINIQADYLAKSLRLLPKNYIMILERVCLSIEFQKMSPLRRPNYRRNSLKWISEQEAALLWENQRN